MYLLAAVVALNNLAAVVALNNQRNSRCGEPVMRDLKGPPELCGKPGVSFLNPIGKPVVRCDAHRRKDR